MRLLDRYIIRGVLRATLLAMAVLLVLMALFLYVNEQGWVGVGRYGNLQAARHVLLVLPGTLLPFVPVAALSGALLAVGQLARGSELTVMRTAGISVARIGGAVFAAGLLLLPAVLVVGEYVAPPLARMARESRAIERDGAISRTAQALWLREDRRILRADEADGGGITLFALGDGTTLDSIARASDARALPDGAWQLGQVRGSRLAGASVVPWQAGTQRLELAGGMDFFSVLARDPGEMSLAQLRHASAWLQAHGLDARRLRLAFWAGIARLVALPLAMLLAVPLISGWLRGTENAARASIGLLLGLAWYIGQRIVESGALAFGLSPAWMALLPTLLLGAATGGMLLRLPRVSAA